MAFKRDMFFLAVFGLFHMGAGQAVTPLTAPSGSNSLPGSNMKADVTATVMGILTESGYVGKPTDANVQELVGMLLSGNVPNDTQLVRMKILPEQPTQSLTTPPPYSVPGRPTFDPSITLTAIGQPTTGQTGSTSAGNSLINLPGAAFSGSQMGTGTGSTDPFASGTSGNSLSFVNLGLNLAAPETTPRPLLGDPFSMTSMTGPTLQNMATLDANALGPKPFANLDPIGNLGTPGSPTDLLGQGLGTGGMGTGGMMPGDFGAGVPNQAGIMDAGMQPRSQPRSAGNPMNMMTMMMLNPELMEGPMAENPMMTYMMMQTMNRPRPQPRPTPPMMPMMDMGGMGGFPGTAGGAPGGMMSLQSPMGGGAGGMMDLMNSVQGGSLSAQGLGGLGSQGMTGLDALGGGASMGLNQGSLAAAAGASPGLTDMRALLNMGNQGMAGPSAAPMMDPGFPAMG